MNNQSKPFEIIATINENLLDKSILSSMIHKGATFFRLNGAFLGAERVEHSVKKIRQLVGNNIKILLDLPGYKIRFLYLKQDIQFNEHTPFTIEKHYLNYPGVFDVFKIGTIIRINDGMDRLKVIELHNDRLICIGHRKGIIRRGKGLHLDSISYRPSTHSLSDFDIQLLQEAKHHGIDYVGLSFIYNLEDIAFIQSHLSESGIKMLPKIESKESVMNLIDVLSASEEFIIDRGDLAGEIGLENIWKTQREIIACCRALDKKIYVATQALSYMVSHPLPSIAEIDSLYALLKHGINGVQLSEETVQGQYALAAIHEVRHAFNQCTHQDLSSLFQKCGKVIWIMGPTGSGKTTIAKEFVKRCQRLGNVMHYDGDEIRNLFPSDHGFSKHDRLYVVKALVNMAKKAADSGCIVVVSALTAYEDARTYIREQIKDLIIVHIDCSIETCMKRDYKGLYQKAINGEINTLVGINTPYIPPDQSIVTISVNSEQLLPSDASKMIMHHLLKHEIQLNGNWSI